MDNLEIAGIYKWNSLKKELTNTAKPKKRKDVTVYSIRMGTNSPRMLFVNLTNYGVINGVNEYENGLYTLRIENSVYEFKTGNDLVEIKKVGGK